MMGEPVEQRAVSRSEPKTEVRRLTSNRSQHELDAIKIVDCRKDAVQVVPPYARWNFANALPDGRRYMPKR